MKKFLKITFIVIIVGFAGLLTLGAITSSQQKEAAEQGGFDSVAEYKKAKTENISTKEEYEVFLKRQAEIDAKAAENGGFLSIDEYKEAKAVSMPTKELYDEYLVQKAELKLAEEKRQAEEAIKAKAEAIRQPKQIIAPDTATESQDEGTNKYLAILKSGLDYPVMGTPYKEIQSVCEKKPTSTMNESEHYSCTGSADDRFLTSRGFYVFGPDKRLKARQFFFRNESDKKDFINDAVILRALDSKYGDRAITQSGKRRYNLQNQDTNFTAVTYGCKGYYVDKPGMYVPGGTPKTHQPVWKETGVVPDLRDEERVSFEVVKNEAVGAPKCVVALVNYGGTNIPTGIDEEQEYKAEVHILEVNPQFGLLNAKHW